MSEIIKDTWKGYIEHNGVQPIAELEQNCWSAWLAAPQESLLGRSGVFPNGQLCVASDSELLATLSVNKIYWDGNPSALPTWDDVAGDPTTYETTYKAVGNTLCLMSMNVSDAGRGKQLPKILINTLVEQAKISDIDFVIGSFRPSAYSKAVKQAFTIGEAPPSFEDYCQTKDETGYPVDPWLRSLTKNGMTPIAVDHNAMEIPLTSQQFEELKQPEWQQIELNGQQVWWCDETGFFYPQPDGSFIYLESNLWGSLYEK